MNIRIKNDDFEETKFSSHFAPSPSSNFCSGTLDASCCPLRPMYKPSGAEPQAAGLVTIRGVEAAARASQAKLHTSCTVLI